MLAAVAGKTDHIRVLLEHKASMDLPDIHGLTAVHLAAWAGHCDVLELFVSSGLTSYHLKGLEPYRYPQTSSGYRYTNPVYYTLLLLMQR